MSRRLQSNTGSGFFEFVLRHGADSSLFCRTINLDSPSMLDLCHATRFPPRLWEVNLLIEPAPDCSIWVSSSRCSNAPGDAGGTRTRGDAPRCSCDGSRVGGACGPAGQAGLVGSGLASRASVLEPVALAVHLHGVDMLGDAVEQRAAQVLGGDDRGPFLEGQVRGDDSGGVLVAPAEYIEQQFAAS